MVRPAPEVDVVLPGSRLTWYVTCPFGFCGQLEPDGQLGQPSSSVPKGARSTPPCSIVSASNVSDPSAESTAPGVVLPGRISRLFTSPLGAPATVTVYWVNVVGYTWSA